MIQESINQMLGTAAIAGRLSPSYENRQAANKLLKEGLSAEEGLKDISQSIEKVEKGEKPAYSESELRDIESRVGSHVSAIGSLKTAVIPGQPTSKYIPTDETGRVKGLSPRESYSEMLTNIEQRLKAIRSMQEKGQAALLQDREFKKLRERIQKDPYVGRTWQRDGGK